jgi:hypothetical protein
MLRCAFCGRRLIGDSGRYRHVNPCAEFSKARRKTVYRNRLVRTPGYSQAANLYERCIPTVLDEVSLRAGLTVAADVFGSMPTRRDEVGLRRVQRDREHALTRYATDRDTAALEAAMARLDEEEAALQSITDEAPDWKEVLPILRDLPTMWREADPPDRRSIAERVFESIDAYGARRLEVQFRCGVQAVVMVGARGLEPTVTSIRTPWSVEASDVG